MQNQSAQADASGREVPLTGPEYVADIHYDEHGLPKTLFDWRWEQKKFWSTARHIWEQLESFFEVSGYILFVTNKQLNCTYGPPQPDALRPPDNYHCVLPEDQTGHKVAYVTWSNKYIPAVRKVDGTHVMIQLVCKGNEGRTELDIMRFFNHPERRHDPRNHTLPILDELQLRDMVFVVVPLLREGLIEPWFFNLGEALDAMHQSFTGPGISSPPLSRTSRSWHQRVSYQLRRIDSKSYVQSSGMEGRAISISIPMSLLYYRSRVRYTYGR